MATSTTPKAILVIGQKEGPEYDAATIGHFAAEETAKCNKAGFDVEVLIFDAQGPHEVSLSIIRKSLGARKWDGVVIGFGVRGDRALTVLFEDTINVCVGEFGITQFGFNSSPGDTAEAVVRAFSA